MATDQAALVSHQGLVRGTIAVAVRLSSIDNLAHLLFLFLGQLNIPRSKVFLQARRLGSSWNRNEPSSSNPRKRDLADGATLTHGEFLDLFHDCLVLVEVFALEFGNWVERHQYMWNSQVLGESRLTCPSEIVWRKVVWSFVVAVVHEPAMSQRTVSNIRHTQFSASVDQSIRLVECLESGIFRLHCIDFGN